MKIFRQMKNKFTGLTLIELLVVLMILAILATIAVPNFTRYYQRAMITKRNYAVVRTFFATDRNTTGKTIPNEMFGVNRANNLTYGACDVSIPRDHRMGELESPSILRLEFREDPVQHVVLLATSINSKDEFFADLASQVRTSRGKTHSYLFMVTT